MSTALKLNIPPQGQKITVDNGVLNVPNRPIIPFIEGDGTGPDIWRARERVLDAAVEKAYGGKRKSTGWKFTPARSPNDLLTTGCRTIR